jgi:hypothetical protein
MYKQSGPYWTQATGYVTPWINVWDLDAIDPANRASVEDGGPACLTPIARPADYDLALDFRNTVAGASDIFPGMGSSKTLVLAHHNAEHQKVWFLDLGTQGWTEQQVTFAQDALNVPVWHMVGHYHPGVGKMIFGGGSYRNVTDPLNRASRRFFTVDAAKSIVPIADAPVVLSVNQQSDARRCCFTYCPSSNKSVAFHADGNIYVYDWTTNAWSTLTGAMQGIRAEWCCTIPERGLILVGDYGHDRAADVHSSALYLFRCD